MPAAFRWRHWRNPDAATRQTKTCLALVVYELLDARKLKHREIGALLGVPQPKVSALKNYRLDQFSVERLMEFLTALNQDVEIMIRPLLSSATLNSANLLSKVQSWSGFHGYMCIGTSTLNRRN